MILHIDDSGKGTRCSECGRYCNRRDAWVRFLDDNPETGVTELVCAKCHAYVYGGSTYNFKESRNNGKS